MAATIYVNSLWTDEDVFNADAGKAADAVWGVNAFASFVSALDAVTAETDKIEVAGEIVEDIPAEAKIVTLSKDLTISSADGSAASVTLNNGGYKALIFESAEGAEDITVSFSNVSVVAPRTQIIFGNSGTADDDSTIYFPVNVEIDADSTVSAYVTAVEYESTLDVAEGGKFFSTGEVMNIKGSMTASGSETFDPASETLTADDRQIVAHYMWDYGTVDLKDSYATIYSQLRLRGADSSFTADNSLIELGKKVDGTWLSNPSANGVGWANIDGTMTLTNKSVLKSSGATGKDGYGMTLNEGAEFNVESGSVAEFSAGVKNDGAINVDNGTLKVGTSWTDPGTQPPAVDLANNGTIEVSGVSTLDIAELTGSTITALDGATLKDSTIGSTAGVELVIGESGVASTVTFEGDNKIAKISVGNGDKIVVGAGDSLSLTGARSAFGGGATWDIDGEIADAKAVTADEKAALTVSLNLAQGLSVSETNGKESVMNVDNAYVTWGGQVTSKNTNAGNGKLTMNFTNSIVDGAAKFSINPTKAGYDAAKAPEIELNFTDSVVEIKNYFTNNNTKGTVTIDNTDFTATAFGNTGTFTAENGSVVNFALVNNALGDWAGKGSLNAGTMTIDASDLTIANKTVSVEFYNVGTITLSNGATFTLDRLVNAQANDLTGAGNINTTFADMTGSITVDATSLLTVNNYFVTNGSITVDGTGFAGGVKKVIDLSGTESLEGKITVENLGEGVNVLYGADGDVLLSSIAADKLYADASFADASLGTDLGDGKFAGINAFATLTDAVKAQTADTTVIEVSSDITEVLSGNTYSGNINAAEGKTVVITDSANNGYANFTQAVLGTGVTVDAKYFYLYGENEFNGNVKSSTTFYSSGKLTMNGNAEVYTAMSRYYEEAEDGIYVVGTAAAGEGKNAAVQFKANNYLGHYSGTFSVKDTAAEFGYILLNGDTDGDGYSKATLVADNASIKTVGGPNTQPGQVLMNGDSAIIGINGSVFDFRGPKDFGYISMGANNSISLTDSEMYLGREGQGGNTLAGTITLTNSKLSSLGKLNSTAAITMDETSSITATTITGEGTITIDVKGYTGDTYKAIDVNSAISNTVKLTNTGNNYYLTYGDDGDVFVTKSPEFVYVSSDYNSSTEGWGVTRFGNYDSAVAFVKTNAQKATMIIEKTTTVSGNCLKDKSEDLGVDLTNTVVVKDGAVVGNNQSKWDMTYAVTIEAGGVLQSVRPNSAGYGNTHVKNKLVIGEAGSDKQAKVLFANGKSGITYKTMSIALLSGLNRSITANNALIEVGDMGLQSTASFTDTTLTIEGILAIKGTSLYKTTMTDTEVTIKGHNLMNEKTYYSTVGTILATLTMDNSSIEVDDKADTTAAEKVWLGYTGNTAQTLTMTNGSSITVEKGTAVEVANTVVMTDSSISVGDLYAGTVKPANSSFYFNSLEKGKVYYAVIYDAEGNEIETIVRTSLNSSTFYPKFSALPVGDYTAKCFTDEAKTELHQEKTYSFVAQGSIDLTNSEIYAEKITLAGNNVSMDINSTIGFTSVEGGYLVINGAEAEGLTGNYQLLDYTGTGTMAEADYKAMLNNAWNDNYKVINNDLYWTDQELGTVYVNSAWAGSKVGETVGSGYIYGFNAVSALDEAASLISKDGSDTVIKFESDSVSNNVDFQYGDGDIIFTADSAVTIKQTSEADWTFVVGDVAPTITIGENVTMQIYSNNSGLYVYYGAGLNVEGTVTGGSGWGCTYLAFGEHTVAATGTISTGRVHLAWSKLTVNGDAESDRTDAHINSTYLLVEESTFTANDAIIKANAVHDSNNGGLRYGASEFNINDSEFTADTVTLKHADTKFNVTGESTVNIGTFSGNYVRFEDCTIVGDSNIGGNIRAYGDMEVRSALTVKQSNWNGTTTIKNGAVLTGGTTIVGASGEFTLENGGKIASRFFNVVGGTADIEGELALDHSDPRQKLLQIHENGVANINDGAAVTISRHNAIVNAGGTLNVNGGSLTITADTVNVAPERGGVIYNAGTVNVNGGQVDIKTLSNTGDVVVNGGTLNAVNMDLFSNFKLSGIAQGDARVITVAFIAEGETAGGFTKEIEVGANATSVDVNFTDIADGKYKLTIIDGTSVSTGTATITNGTLDINGGKVVLDALNINSGAANVSGESTVVIENQSGVVNVNDGAVLTDSKLGTVYAYGTTEWKGTNTIKAFSLGWDNSGADIEVSMTGTANVANFMIGNSEGFTSTLNIGSADGERTTVNGNQHNYTTNSVVNVVNADVTGNYVSMTGAITVTDSSYSGFGDFRVVAGYNHTIDPMVKLDNSSISGSYGYIGGWSATASGYGVLELVNNSTWKSNSGSCATANSTITLDNSDMNIGGTFTMYGTLAMDVDSMITFKGLDLGTSGTITIDMADINTASGNKLFDYTGSNTVAWDLDAYKAIISNWNSDMDKFFAVEDGDLIVKANAVAYVTGTTDASKNEFATHAEAIASGAVRIITVDSAVTSGMIEHDGVEAVITGGTFNGTVSGGAITESDAKTWDDRSGDVSMTIEGGEFNKMVIGADRVVAGNTERIGDVNTVITGGTFNSIVTGGMLYADQSLKGQALLTGDVNLTIAGGEFNKYIYGGNITATAAYSSRTAIDGDINITIDAGSNAIAFNAGSMLVAGSYRQGVVDGNITVTLKGLSSNLIMDDTFQIWGGSSSDVYLDDADRTFQTAVTGDRTFVFDGFEGEFAARIRGFEAIDIVGGSSVELTGGNLSDISDWEFEAGSSLDGVFGNDFTGDTLEIDLGSWEDSSCDLMTGSASIFEGFDSLDAVIVGGESLTYDGVSKWASSNYELELKDGEDDQKVLAFTNKLA